MGLWKRMRDSLRDGSSSRKVLARALGPRWVPARKVLLDEYLAAHYPEEQWKPLSATAREAWVQYSPVFTRNRIRTIVYVGAHVGDTALALDEAFAGRRFVLLEPAPKIYRQLSANVADRPNMTCLNVAAGASQGLHEFFLDNSPAASSLLPYESIALDEFPFLGHVSKISVPVRPLDAIVSDYSLLGQVDMLIMDVQGYEDEVLRGAERTVESCRIVVSELSLQALYAGSSTFDSVYQGLARRGYCLRFLLNPLEGVNHRILQIDGVFVREPPQA